MPDKESTTGSRRRPCHRGGPRDRCRSRPRSAAERARAPRYRGRSMPVSTSTTDLGESKVRLDVEVPGDAVEREVQRVAAAAGPDMENPRFPKGQGPPEGLSPPLGRPARLDEARPHGTADRY